MINEPLKDFILSSVMIGLDFHIAFIDEDYRVRHSQIPKIRSCVMALLNISFGLLFLSLVLDSLLESRSPYSTHQFRKTQLRHQTQSIANGARVKNKMATKYK